MAASSMINFCGVELASCLSTASGTFGFGLEAWRENFISKNVGLVVLKGLSLDERLGAPQPRVYELDGGLGLVNAIGLQNPGIKNFLAQLNEYKEFPRPMVLNLLGFAVGDYARLVSECESVLEQSPAGQNFVGYELNVSCPNVDHGGQEFGSDPKVLAQIVRDASAALKSKRFLMPKLSPFFSDRASELARAAQEAGAHALCIGNTYPVLGGGAGSQRLLGRDQGGLSGPALMPLQKNFFSRVRAAVPTLPLVYCGGVRTRDDVQSALAQGASLVQVGTAVLSNPWVFDLLI